MQRDSNQPPKPADKSSSKRGGVPVTANPPQPTGGMPPSAASRSEPTTASRKRRPSRLALQDSGAATDLAAAESRVPKGSRRPNNTTAPAAKAPIHRKRPRVSALDAAAQVLGELSSDEANLGITAQALIERMAKQKLWTSPGGKTPQATLYAAMVREITAKGASARFRKVSRGRFVAAAAAVGSSASKFSAGRAAPAPAAPASAPRKRIKP